MQMAIGENVGLETYAADPAAMPLQRGKWLIAMPVLPGRIWMSENGESVSPS